MLATIADTAKDLGALCGALAAIVAFVVVLVKLPPVRWVVRHLVTEPLSQWFRHQVREEMERTNGGSTLMDRMSRVEGAAIAAEQRLGRIERALDIPDRED